MVVHHMQGYYQQYVTGTHLHTWEKREKVPYLRNTRLHNTQKEALDVPMIINQTIWSTKNFLPCCSMVASVQVVGII